MWFVIVTISQIPRVCPQSQIPSRILTSVLHKLRNSPRRYLIQTPIIYTSPQECEIRKKRTPHCLQNEKPRDCVCTTSRSFPSRNIQSAHQAQNRIPTQEMTILTHLQTQNHHDKNPATRSNRYPTTTDQLCAHTPMKIFEACIPRNL